MKRFTPVALVLVALICGGCLNQSIAADKPTVSITKPSPTGSLPTELALPAIFGDHMVLQRDKPVPVWGWAKPGAKVVVSFDEQSKTAIAGKAGFWIVRLNKLAASADPLQLVVMTPEKAFKIKDVLVGEVWICSGQSNMGWSLARTTAAEQEIAEAKHPQIRLITTAQHSTSKIQSDFKGTWSACTPETAKSFSAVGYFFGRKLHRELKVPIGLINTSWGGTRVEAWTSDDALRSANPKIVGPLLKWWDKQASSYNADAAKKKNDDALVKWKAAVAKAKAAKKRAPRRPRLAADPAEDRHHPSNLYNGKIAPLIPFAMRGAIWYQGESNVARADQYQTLFPLMIRNWRQKWAQGDFPFYFVQLAPFRYRQHNPALCAELWETQLWTLKNVKNTGMAVTVDIATTKNIHPPNKQDVGSRLALWAMAKDYAKDVIFSGPIYKSVAFKGNKATISFDHVPVTLTTNDSQPPTHFQIAGEDKVFHDAKTKLSGDKVEVWSDDVAKPVAVRFAWQDDAEPTLQNSANLPASPFRTDDWPRKSKGKLTP
jgi:sialate O-acetylesterase